MLLGTLDGGLSVRYDNFLKTTTSHACCKVYKSGGAYAPLPLQHACVFNIKAVDEKI